MTNRKQSRGSLVRDAAEQLRDRSISANPGELLGSLADLARMLGVGSVTLQQAARVVEHEGLLTARRGPGGGYYAARPDAAALDRALSAFLRTNPGSFREAIDVTSLLFIELAAAAAKCDDLDLRKRLAVLSSNLGTTTGLDLARFERDFQDLLFLMVDWPLFELLTKVTLRFAENTAPEASLRNADQLGEWLEGRRRIIAAILAGDADLARFEAVRSNRQVVLQRY